MDAPDAMLGEPSTDRDLMGCDRDMCKMWKEGCVDRIRKELERINKKYDLL